MAFKRSAVRSRLFPPSPESETKDSFLKRNESFVLCGDFCNVYSRAELRKVNVEINVQLIALIYRHPTA